MANKTATWRWFLESSEYFWQFAGRLWIRGIFNKKSWLISSSSKRNAIILVRRLLFCVPKLPWTATNQSHHFCLQSQYRRCGVGRKLSPSQDIAEIWSHFRFFTLTGSFGHSWANTVTVTWCVWWISEFLALPTARTWVPKPGVPLISSKCRCEHASHNRVTENW